MDKLDYSLSMLWHNNAVEYYGNPMAMNVACMITNLLCECDKCIYSSEAALKGHVKCLKKLHKNGCKWNADTCANAALNGHLDCLKYAHKNGYEWGSRTCANAAFYGHLDCLKYALENMHMKTVVYGLKLHVQMRHIMVT